MPVIFGIIGAALGATLGTWGTAVLGFGVGFLLSRLTQLGQAHLLLWKQVEELRERYDGLERELRKVKREAAAPAPQPPSSVPSREPVAPPPPVPPITAVEQPPVPTREAPRPEPSLAPSTPPPIPEPPPFSEPVPAQ